MGWQKAEMAPGGEEEAAAVNPIVQGATEIKPDWPGDRNVCAYVPDAGEEAFALGIPREQKAFSCWYLNTVG